MVVVWWLFFLSLFQPQQRLIIILSGWGLCEAIPTYDKQTNSYRRNSTESEINITYVVNKQTAVVVVVVECYNHSCRGRII